MHMHSRIETRCCGAQPALRLLIANSYTSRTVDMTEDAPHKSLSAVLSRIYEFLYRVSPSLVLDDSASSHRRLSPSALSAGRHIPVHGDGLLCNQMHRPSPDVLGLLSAEHLIGLLLCRIAVVGVVQQLRNASSQDLQDQCMSLLYTTLLQCMHSHACMHASCCPWCMLKEVAACCACMQHLS